MKKVLFMLLFLLTAILGVMGQSLAKLDEKNGFKSIILGDSISKYKDFPILGGTESAIYDGSSSGLSIGDIPLKSIGIVTFKGRISRVIIFFEPEYGYKIHGVLKEAYGFYTRRPNQFMDKYEWESENVTLLLDYDSKGKNGSMSFSSKEVIDQERKYNNQKEKKAVNDL